MDRKPAENTDLRYEDGEVPKLRAFVKARDRSVGRGASPMEAHRTHMSCGDCIIGEEVGHRAGTVERENTFAVEHRQKLVTDP